MHDSPETTPTDSAPPPAPPSTEHGAALASLYQRIVEQLRLRARS